MANNPYVNKVVFGDNTVMDISGDTATPSDVLKGETFHDKSGALQVGTLSLDEFATIDLIKDTVGWTGKNLLKLHLTSGSTNGVNYTVNVDGSISLSGTATNDAYLTLHSRLNDPIELESGNYILNGCPANGGGSTYQLYFAKSDGSSITDYFYDNGNGVSFSYDGQYNYTVNILVKSGQNVDGKVFYPMIRKVSITDDTYEPYHPSVEQTLRDAEVIEGKNLVDIHITDTQFINATKVPEGHTDVIISCNSTGVGQCNVRTFNADGTTYGNDYAVVENGNTSGSKRLTIPSGGSISLYRVSGDNSNFSNFMLRDATEEDPTYEPYYIPLKDSKFDRSEQRVLGAKNRFHANTIVSKATDVGVTITEDGKTIRVNNTTAGSYKMVTFQMPVEKSTNYLFTSDVLVTSGSALIAISDSSSDIIAKAPTDGKINIEFNSGDRTAIRVKMLCTQSTSEIGDVTYSNNMLRLASDPDNTYVPYAMTNKELTDSLDGWTAASQVANGEVSFSGLDDTQGWGYDPRIWVDNNSTNLNPYCKIKTITGAGTANMSITYDTDADNGAYVRLRIIK